MKLEREVGIADLFWYVVSKWRLLILALVIGAILAAGYSYIRTGKIKTDNTGSGEISTTATITVNDLDDTDIATLNLYFQYLGQVKDQTEYITSAEFMKIDPYEAFSSSASYYIKCQDASSLSGVLEAYSEICSELNSKYDGLFEFEIEKDSERYKATSEGMEEEGETGAFSLSANGILRINMLAQDPETAEANLAAVEKEINKRSEDLNKSVSPHTLEKLGSYLAKTESEHLMSRQKSAADTLYSLTNSAVGTKKLLSENGALYAEMILQDPEITDYREVVISEADNTTEQVVETKTETQQPSTSLKKRISKKLVVLGGLGLFVIAVLLLMIGYLLGKKLCPEDDLSRQYGVPSFGFIRDPLRKKKTAFDSFIEKKRLRRVVVLEGENADQMLAANIELQTKKTGAKTIYATGTVFGEKEKALVRKAVPLMKEKGIDLIVGEAVLENAEAVKQLGESEGTVILENLSGSDRLQLAKLIRFCKERNITPIGVAIVE